MPTLEFWMILSLFIDAFPVVFFISWIFPEDMANYWVILQLGNSENIVFPAIFFGFGMLAVGLFVDGLRHSFEWLVEYVAKSESLVAYTDHLQRRKCLLNFFILLFLMFFIWLIIQIFVNSCVLSSSLSIPFFIAIYVFRNKFMNTLGFKDTWKNILCDPRKKQCAFYPRLRLEDVTNIDYDPRKKEAAQALLNEKLRRYNIRYFFAEGILSFAIGCLISIVLFQLACGTDLFEKRKCYNEIPIAFWFTIILAPVAIFMSFMWCRDKAFFINNLLHIEKKIDILSLERRCYFSIFILWYLVVMVVNTHLEIFKRPSTVTVGGILFAFSAALSAYMIFPEPEPGQTRTRRRWFILAFAIIAFLWWLFHVYHTSVVQELILCVLQ